MTIVAPTSAIACVAVRRRCTQSHLSDRLCGGQTQVYPLELRDLVLLTASRVAAVRRRGHRQVAPARVGVPLLGAALHHAAHAAELTLE